MAQRGLPAPQDGLPQVHLLLTGHQESLGEATVASDRISLLPPTPSLLRMGCERPPRAGLWSRARGCGVDKPDGSLPAPCPLQKEPSFWSRRWTINPKRITSKHEAQQSLWPHLAPRAGAERAQSRSAGRHGQKAVKSILSRERLCL